jgi:hypothetical protein
MSGLFTPDLKEQMKNLDNEYSLEGLPGGEYVLNNIISNKFLYSKPDLQPGEPTYKEFTFTNESGTQPMHFILEARNGELNGVILELDNHREVYLDVVLADGEKLKYNGGEFATVFDRNWKKQKEMDIREDDLLISEGEHTLNLDIQKLVGKEAEAGIEIRLKTKEWKLKSK